MARAWGDGCGDWGEQQHDGQNEAGRQERDPQDGADNIAGMTTKSLDGAISRTR